MPLRPGGRTLYRLSVDDVARMLGSSVLTEDTPVELLDGVLVDVVPRAPCTRRRVSAPAKAYCSSSPCWPVVRTLPAEADVRVNRALGALVRFTQGKRLLFDVIEAEPGFTANAGTLLAWRYSSRESHTVGRESHSSW